MANGQGSHDLEAVWKAVDGLRAQVQLLSERTAVLGAKANDHHEDIGASRLELARAEATLSAEIQAAEERINQRFDRLRNWVIGLGAIAVPIVSAVLGALAQGGGS